MLYFHTDTEIPLEALRLMGASTKGDDETKIGFFGTGFKYAIATLLREGIAFGITINGVDVEISTRKTTMRDIEFDEIYVNDTPTSYTTRIGIDWLVWHAVREIWQNTVDENGIVVRGQEAEPFGNGSVFWIDEESNEELAAIIECWEDYFRDTNWEGVERNIELDFLRVFYRGMRVSGDKQFSLFSYGVTRTQVLNEMRLLRDYAQEYLIEDLMQRCFTKEDWEYMFKHLEREDSFEWARFQNMTFYGSVKNVRDALTSYRIYPEGWKDVIYQFPQPLMVTLECMTRLMYSFPELDYAVEAGGYIPVECEKCQQKLLKVAMRIQSLTGLELPVKLEIGNFLQDTTLGVQLGAEEKIVIAHGLLNGEIDYLTEIDLWSTVLEEMVHLSTGHEDNSRALESFLFDMIAGNLLKGQKFN